MHVKKRAKKSHLCFCNPSSWPSSIASSHWLERLLSVDWGDFLDLSFLSDRNFPPRYWSQFSRKKSSHLFFNMRVYYSRTDQAFSPTYLSSCPQWAVAIQTGSFLAFPFCSIFCFFFCTVCIMQLKRWVIFFLFVCIFITLRPETCVANSGNVTGLLIRESL